MTLFVTTGAVSSDREFWWDALTRVFLETPSLPAELAMTVAEKNLRWDIPPSNDHYGRDKVYREVWASLRELLHEDQNRHVMEIARWASCELTARPEHRAMTRDEVRDISDGLISIGAHTVSHPTLPAHSFEAQCREITGSRSACEALAGRSVDMFAYPFGDHDDRTVSAVRRAGFRYAYTSHAGVVGPGADPMRLPRLHIGNWDGDEFLRKIADGSFP